VTDRDFVAIGRLMDRRARAVIDGHESAFMATVDGTRASFVSAQRVTFQNLQDLPLTSMSYTVGKYGLTNAPGITGGPLLSPAVTEKVFFADTDQHPMAVDVSDTFVERDGHWRLAADTTNAASSGGVTARPWAGPRIDVVVRGPLIVVADASEPGRATSVADTVESDLSFDAGILDVAVDDHLIVDATSSGSVSKFDNDESAGAVTFPVDGLNRLDETQFAGMRVKLNPQYITQLLSDKVILRHELTHYLMFRYSGLTPKWLTEGLAEYVAHQPEGLSSEYMTSETYDRLMKGPRQLMASGVFGLDPSTDYPLAMACVAYLIDHGGMGKLKQLMDAYTGYTDEVFGDQHTGPLLHQIYGMTPADVAHGAFDLLGALR
jgi:hypothetical protein